MPHRVPGAMRTVYQEDDQNKNNYHDMQSSTHR